MTNFVPHSNRRLPSTECFTDRLLGSIAGAHLHFTSALTTSCPSKFLGFGGGSSTYAIWIIISPTGRGRCRSIRGMHQASGSGHSSFGRAVQISSLITPVAGESSIHPSHSLIQLSHYHFQGILKHGVNCWAQACPILLLPSIQTTCHQNPEGVFPVSFYYQPPH